MPINIDTERCANPGPPLRYSTLTLAESFVQGVFRTQYVALLAATGSAGTATLVRAVYFDGRAIREVVGDDEEYDHLIGLMRNVFRSRTEKQLGMKAWRQVLQCADISQETPTKLPRYLPLVRGGFRYPKYPTMTMLPEQDETLAA